MRVSFSTRRTEWVSLSSMPKSLPASYGDSITTERQNASNVSTWTSLASSAIPSFDISRLMRSSISAAALRVKVRRSTSRGVTAGSSPVSLVMRLM